MPLAKGRVLSSILKCSRCRRDKAKVRVATPFTGFTYRKADNTNQCLPEARQWPGEPCYRCAKYGYDCSEGTPSKPKKCLEGKQARAENREFPRDSHGETSTAEQSQQLAALPRILRSMQCREYRSLSLSEQEMADRGHLLRAESSNVKLGDSAEDSDERVESPLRNISPEDRHIIRSSTRRPPPTRSNRIVHALRRTEISTRYVDCNLAFFCA